MGTLYIVGTPIGNLEDMTYRAVRILENVDLIAAEDTRHSGRLLQHFDVRARLISFHGDSSEIRIEEILDVLADGDVALITDAGMPGISDPGVELVRAVSSAGIDIEVIPGPSAVTSAVALSGLVDAGFLFAGYAPRRSRDRVPFFTRVLGTGYPVVVFESPHRIVDSLADLAGIYPDQPVAVCRELTKLHETVYRGSVAEVVAQIGDPPPPGEYVVVISALVDSGSDVDDVGEAETIARTLLDQGLATSKVAREVARTCRISRSDAYDLVLKLKDES
ncbi:MAG: 16S rRNA (cytidine(1402)-2'-O)-methyltransferase [Sphaerobacteraceae bacterium]|nr:MAG: 16S rRNA (cytidine(1402)-2'-O)-methyltransferase [Sphaerobacteraceae bacterium]